MPFADGDVMNGLLGKIYAIMTAPNNVVPNAVDRRDTSSGQPPFISFCSPGIAIDSLDFGNLLTPQQVNDCSDFTDIVDTIPAVSGTWSRTVKKTWDIYQLAITDIQLPISNLLPDEEKMLQNAQKFLRNTVTVTDPITGAVKTRTYPSDAYLAYEKLFTAYGVALKAYNNSRITAISNPTPQNVADWTNNGPFYQSEVQNAYDMWGSLGYRDEVQEANGIISSLGGRGPYAMYDRLKSQFNLSAQLDFKRRTFYPTFASPPTILGPDFANSWTKFTFSHSEINQFATASSSSWGGGVGANFGLWSASASVQYSNSQTHNHCSTNGIDLSIEIIQVPISRGWWSPWVFSSRGWKGVNELSINGCISNGNSPLTGLMPVIPTSLILARNLRINMDMSTQDNKTALSSINSSMSGGWGPFSVRGNYSSSTASSSSDVTSDATGLSFANSQIIGFIGDVLPMSPNPDPNLNWPNIRALKAKNKSFLEYVKYFK